MILRKTIITSIKFGFVLAAILFGLAHTALFNYVMQKKERAALTRITQFFTPYASIAPQKLAILCPAAIEAIDEMLTAAFDLCASQGLKIEIKKFYHNGDLALLKSQIEESILWKAKAIISVGGSAAATAHAILTKRESTIPHIFACVSNPVELGLSSDKHYAGPTSTGTAEDVTGILDGFVRSFKHVRPDARSVLIFNGENSPKGHQEIEDLIAAFANQHVTARCIHTATADEVIRASHTYISKDIDAVIVLRDFAVVSAIQSIIKACQVHGVTVFASDSGSVINGAVAGCCVGEAELGLLLGEIILKVVHYKIPCSQIPITYFTTAKLYRTYVNQFEMHRQGLENRSIYDLMSGEAKLEFLRHRPKPQE
jgi:ABC-type uncharacterized transport system substrate-binding protein